MSSAFSLRDYCRAFVGFFSLVVSVISLPWSIYKHRSLSIFKYWNIPLILHFLGTNLLAFILLRILFIELIFIFFLYWGNCVINIVSIVINQCGFSEENVQFLNWKDILAEREFTLILKKVKFIFIYFISYFIFIFIFILFFILFVFEWNE